MGCASSSFHRRRSPTPPSKPLPRPLVAHHHRRSISVVGLILDTDYALRFIERESSDALSHLSVKGRGRRPLLDDKVDDVVPSEHLHLDELLSRSTLLSPSSNAEGSNKLSTLQERRLRRANLEVPVVGLTDFTSDEDEDAGDGFEFAKLEPKNASFNLDEGPIWTPITRFRSEGEDDPSFRNGTFISEQVTSPKRGMDPDSSVSDPDHQQTFICADDNCDFPLSDTDSSVPSSIVSAFEKSPSATYNQVAETPSSEVSSFLPVFRKDIVDDSGSLSPSSTIPYEKEWNHSSAPWQSPSPSEGGYQFENEDSSWEHPSPQWDPSSHSDALIPGLPDDLAGLCLMRVPFIKYNHIYRIVSRRWKAVLSSEEFFKARDALGIHEVHISFVVHGNRVQIFSLQARQWFCLPPLPREDGNISPGWRHSPEWDVAHQYSPRCNSDWGIDPYDWWQIDTVAVSKGSFFIIGGDQAEIHSFCRPSKPTNRVHKYDFCRNRWVSVSPMQVPRSHAAAVSLGKLIYVAGGSEDLEGGYSAEVYDSEQNEWTAIPAMNTSMRTCVGLGHAGCFYVKGENRGSGGHVDGDIFDPLECMWNRMSPGMRRGLERGPIASCGDHLFVADWKDSLLKIYHCVQDLWVVVTKLPARISRLVGYRDCLYGLTGKVKVDPYNHQVISDAPAEVWRLDITSIMTNLWIQDHRGRYNDCWESSDYDVFPENLSLESSHDCKWECLWWDPKQMVKTGGLAWVPCIAHCTLFED